ncbi:sugar ABC transporter substrate-binding protein [Paracoccus sp. (in: a-proteobacteria)]|uniref:rhizopine catabolism ABC transporter substrate-binding protein n=1 Tax=Paracoccus sp. TaxID=267 RepID=UPI003A870FBA
MNTLAKMTRRGLAVVAMGAAALLVQPFGAAEAQMKEAKDIRVVFVTHGQANDVYWTIVKNGMLEASKNLGVTVEYQAPETFDVVRMARMIEAATASKPDGLVVSIPDAAALKAPIENAKAAGIPVIVIDTGEDQVGEWGLDLFVGGGSEYDNGVNAGKIMAEAGVTQGLCVNHEVGNVSLDKRCQGFNDGLSESGGKATVVSVTMDPTDATRRVEAAMSANPDATGVLTLGPTVGAPVLKMLEERGRLDSIRIGTFDLSPEVLDAVDQGKMMFAIDNQQFLMGYYPVMFLAAKAMYQTFPPQAVRTGPAFIMQDAAAAVRDLSKAGFR